MKLHDFPFFASKKSLDCLKSNLSAYLLAKSEDLGVIRGNSTLISNYVDTYGAEIFCYRLVWNLSSSVFSDFVFSNERTILNYVSKDCGFQGDLAYACLYDNQLNRYVFALSMARVTSYTFVTSFEFNTVVTYEIREIKGSVDSCSLVNSDTWCHVSSSRDRCDLQAYIDRVSKFGVNRLKSGVIHA